MDYSNYKLIQLKERYFELSSGIVTKSVLMAVAQSENEFSKLIDEMDDMIDESSQIEYFIEHHN